MKRLPTHDRWLKENLWVKLLRCTCLNEYQYNPDSVHSYIYHRLWMRLWDRLMDWNVEEDT